MYHGHDRVKQVDAPKDMARDISFYDDEGTVEEKVTFYVEECMDEDTLPDWFDDHDFELLVGMVND